MAHYQLRRPSPVKIYPKLTRRQDGTATTMPLTKEQKEEKEGPESPDSPFSSPSTVGGQSDSEDSDSDDEKEPPSPSESSSISKPVETLGPESTSAPPLPTSSSSPSPPSLSSSSPSSSSSASSSSSSSSSSSLSLSTSKSSTSATSLPVLQSTSPTPIAVLPLITGTTLTTTSLPSATSTPGNRSQSDRQKQASPTVSVSLPPPPPPPLSTAEAELSGQTGASEMARKPEPTIMTKQAMIAAIVLGILGALALLVAAVVFIKRRRARSYMDHVLLPDEKFDSSTGQNLRAPETAHTGTASSIFARLQGASNGGGERHLTRSTNRSNTLFGPGPYLRPETVSTTRNNSQIPPPTPNPFEDPQRNKAYDMLNNRPRSTTLTDRGSWRENPFKNPESDRFDPFGELKEKARQERLRYLQQVKREAELQRQMEQKEAMGLRPDDMPWGHDHGYR